MIKFNQMVALMQPFFFFFCKICTEIVDWVLDQSPFLLIIEDNCFMKVKIIATLASNGFLWKSYQNIPEVKSKLIFIL